MSCDAWKWISASASDEIWPEDDCFRLLATCEVAEFDFVSPSKQNLSSATTRT